MTTWVLGRPVRDPLGPRIAHVRSRTMRTVAYLMHHLTPPYPRRLVRDPLGPLTWRPVRDPLGPQSTQSRMYVMLTVTSWHVLLQPVMLHSRLMTFMTCL